MKKQVLFTILMLFSMGASAHDIEVANADGVTIYYNYTNDGKELEVTSSPNKNKYMGNVVIPEEVTYMNRTRKVTSTGQGAFSLCEGLTSVTIPNSVTSIGIGTFSGCSGLTSIIIPNSVTSIGENAFSRCTNLASITIGNSVTSVGPYAFSQCSNLTSITIPNSVTSIGEYAFFVCEDLTSITIGNSVASIGFGIFLSCGKLSSIIVDANNTTYDSRENCNAIIETATNTLISGCNNTVIPNSVMSIGEAAFNGCSCLTSINIPNSVTSIGRGAFYNCSNLTSVTIGNNVTSIGDGAFYGADISTVISLIENPFTITGKASDYRSFTLNTFNNATLYVPKGTINKYKATVGWMDFMFIEEGTGPNGGGETPEQCATPTIAIKDGKLSFSCETEGVTFCYSVTPPSQFNGEGNDVSLSNKYTISVYAKKEGYENSETVTKEIEVGGMMGDMNGDGIISVTDVGILITTILQGE